MIGQQRLRLQGAFGGERAAVGFMTINRPTQRPGDGLENRLYLVMGVAAMNQVDVQVTAQMFCEGKPEMSNQLGRQVADLLTSEIGIKMKKKAAREIHDGAGKRLVHRNVGRTIPSNECFVGQCLTNGLAQGDPHILHRVVLINVQIAFAPHLEVESTMAREQIEHVIEEANPCCHFVFALAVEAEVNPYLRLPCFARDGRSALSQRNCVHRV